MKRRAYRREHGSIKRQAFQGMFRGAAQVPTLLGSTMQKAREFLLPGISSTASCLDANTSQGGSLQQSIRVENLPDLTINPRHITAIPEEPLPEEFKGVKDFDGSPQPILGSSDNDDNLGTEEVEPLPEKYKDVKDFVMDEEKRSILFKNEAGKWVVEPLFKKEAGKWVAVPLF